MVQVQNLVHQPKTCNNCNGSGQINQTVETPFGRMVNRKTCNYLSVELEKLLLKNVRLVMEQDTVQKRKKIKVTIPAGVDDGQQLRVSGQGEPGKNGGPPGDLYIVFNVGNHELF